MTSDRVSRHRARQDKLNTLREHRDEMEPYCVPISTKKVAKGGAYSDYLEEFSQQQLEERASFFTPVSVSVEEANILINDIRSRWNQHQMNLLLGTCRSSVLSSIVTPFGLGQVVAANDKTGGNITTVNNAEQGIYAKDEDQKRYEATFDRKDYEGGGLGPKRKKLFQTNEQVIDAYKGSETPKDGRTHLDHVISAKEIHDDKWLRLSANSKARDKIAVDESNLVPTDSALNQSKSDRDLIAWMNSKRKDGRTNADHFGVNTAKAQAAYDRAQRSFKFNKSVAIATHIGTEATVSGVQEGSKMGLQQSLGLLLSEFFAATFDEISDAYKTGFRDSLKYQSFFDALKVRLTRIASRVGARWKDALVAFKEGAISGFLSNLVTMLINMLVTTGKRIVRVIREGFMSILKALKLALFPPNGMSSGEAIDAALKLLTTGITVSLGILAEETVEKAVALFFNTNIPPLAPFASTVSVVFVGAMTGIASALLVYGLDKLDLFGVNASPNVSQTV